MKVTTQTIIEILPFDAEFKKDLLERLPTMTPDQKYTTVQLLWDAYADLYDIRFEANTRIALLAVEKGEDTFDADFYKRVKEKTEQDMKKQHTQAETHDKLSEAREELEKILKQSN